MKDIKDNKKPHIKVFNGIKGKKKRKNSKAKKLTNYSTSKANKKVRKNKKKKPKKSFKRKLGKDYYESVWHQSSVKKRKR